MGHDLNLFSARGHIGASIFVFSFERSAMAPMESAVTVCNSSSSSRSRSPPPLPIASSAAVSRPYEQVRFQLALGEICSRDRRKEHVELRRERLNLIHLHNSGANAQQE